MFFNAKKKKSDVISPYCGTCVKIEDVDDQVFSEKVVGDGIAVDLTSPDVLSPIDGTVTMATDTKHAFGLTDASGTEYLLHIGINTVTLNGEGFESYVEENDKVKKGQLLCRVNLALLKERGISTVSMFIVTNKELKSVYTGSDVEHGTENILAIK